MDDSILMFQLILDAILRRLTKMERRDEWRNLQNNKISQIQDSTQT